MKEYRSTHSCSEICRVARHIADSLIKSVTEFLIKSAVGIICNFISFIEGEPALHHLKTDMILFANHYADLVGTYDISDQQKMNITLEEAIYVLEKNGIDFSKKELVEYLIEYYFTQNPSITDKQIDTYCRVLTESPLLEAEDISYATSILENRNVKDYSSINRAINTFLTEANKTPEGVVDVIRVALSNTSTEDISANIDKLIMLVWKSRQKSISHCPEAYA